MDGIPLTERARARRTRVQVLGLIKGPEGTPVRLLLTRPAAGPDRRVSYTAALTRASLPAR